MSELFHSIDCSDCLGGTHTVYFHSGEISHTERCSTCEGRGSIEISAQEFQERRRKNLIGCLLWILIPLFGLVGLVAVLHLL